MASLADQFFITQRLADEAQASQLANRRTLEEMARVKRAEENEKQFLEAMASRSRVPTAPSGAPPMAEMGASQPFMPQSGAFARSVDLMRGEVARLDEEIGALGGMANPFAYKAREQMLKAREGTVEKLRIAEKNDFDMRLKDAQAQRDLFSGITNQQALDVVASQMSPEVKKQLASAGVFPDLDGRYNFNNPFVRGFIDSAKNLALTQVQRLEQEKRIADIKDAEIRRALDAKKAAETERHNRANEALQRERMSTDKEIAGTGLTEKTAARGAEIRKEQRDALKPIEPLQDNLTKIRSYLATSNTASDRQLNAALTDLDGNVRATNMLFKDNKNFGSLAGKLSGFVSQVFTGRYTEEQRRQIREMVDGLENGVIKPTRNRVGAYYKDIAAATGVPGKLVETPNFYADDPAKEAEAFLKAKGLLQ